VFGAVEIENKRTIKATRGAAMDKARRSPARFLLATAMAAFILSGCATLTEKQLSAVSQFAKATENYGPVPSNAIKTWADLQIAASAAEVSSMQSEQAMWKHIETSFNTYQRIMDRSERAIKSFEILDQYSRLLLQLTSDNYTEALNAKSKDLGESIDSSIDYYNSRFGTSISGFGGDAAGILRAGFGLYIRARQAEVLRNVVKEADPAIEELTKAITTTLDAVELGIEKEADTLEKEVRAMLRHAPQIETGQAAKKIIPDLASYIQAFELIQRARNATQIIASAKASAVQYRKTHQKLLENTRDKTEDVQDLLPMIAALKKEIDAGIRLRKSVKD
jgi:hypothetical protein